ncbi:hypothetical protein BJ170DRAFT_680959 [Xylariales sp. AK1849]|nr:hypothetical protein BJ170DRAFT_680959 [Xylariales sp. AK1849]
MSISLLEHFSSVSDNEHGTQYHTSLRALMRILEEACFEFAQKWLPAILREEDCDYASAIELTKWTRLLAKNANSIPEGAIELGKGTLNQTLFATSKLRHSAVHRLATTTRGIRDLLRAGLSLASALRDHERAAQFEELCDELDDKIGAMELNKNDLENNAGAGLKEIQRQREELDRQERELIANMLKHDADNKVFIGTLLEDSVGRIFHETPEDEATNATKSDAEAVEDEEEDPQAEQGMPDIEGSAPSVY